MRIAQPFDLDEEDILPSRPAPFDSLAVEIDPPNWALKAISKRGGRRHPRRQKFLSDGWQSTDHTPGYTPMGLVPYSPTGPMGPHWPHAASIDNQHIYDKALNRHNRKKGSGKTPSVKKSVPSGNLRGDDYKFWKGYPLMDTERHWGRCRWCNVECHGLSTMDKHFKSGYCRESLQALYRYALHSSKQRYCFACKKQTQERHWGIPLCRTTDCWGKWKFNFSESLDGFVHYKNWALADQARNPTDGPFAGLPLEDEDYSGTPC